MIQMRNDMQDWEIKEGWNEMEITLKFAMKIKLSISLFFLTIMASYSYTHKSWIRTEQVGLGFRLCNHKFSEIDDTQRFNKKKKNFYNQFL